MHILENPAWSSLTTTHRHLGRVGEKAAIYSPQVSVIGALKENTLSAYAELRSLATPGIPVAIIGFKVPEELEGWSVLQRAEAYQMICVKPIQHPPIKYRELTSGDLPAIMKLVEETKPGPFSPETIKMGRYIGVWKEGELIAMGGERLKPEGYVELSGICTKPAEQGKGWGTAITGVLTNSVLEHEETLFLHVFKQNNTAFSLYEKLGYITRKIVPVTAIMRQS